VTLDAQGDQILRTIVQRVSIDVVNVQETLVGHAVDAALAATPPCLLSDPPRDRAPVRGVPPRRIEKVGDDLARPPPADDL
jgi:hypothetical protein